MTALIFVMLCILFFMLFISTIIFIKFDMLLLRTILFIIILLIIFSCCGVIAEAHEYSAMDIVSIGKIVEHEAPNESELGKRLVIDTILNRVESDEFPNTVQEVLRQPGQYCNPKKYPPKEVYTLIAEEIYNRTNSSVLWYKTKSFHKYGFPVIKEGNHYFSGK